MLASKMPSPSKMMPGKRGADAEIKGTDAANPRTQRIVDRLNKVVEENSNDEKHRSSDLTPLLSDFEKMRHKLRSLVNAIKKYQKETEGISDARLELAEHFKDMAVGSPLEKAIGEEVDQHTLKTIKDMRERTAKHDASEPTTTQDVKDLLDDFDKDALSLLSSTRFAAAQATANDNEYQSHIVNYVEDWERLVSDRIDSEMKKVKELEADRRHYEDKIEALRKKYHHKEEKGKELKDKEEEKVERNEEKLKEAFEAHEREAGKVYALLNAVTKDGYKDLFPLVKNYLKWDMNRINREHDVAERLSKILDSMKDEMKNEPVEEDEPEESASSSNNNKTTEPSKDQPESNNAEQ